MNNHFYDANPVELIKPSRQNIFDNANKIRKSWVLAVTGSKLELKLIGYPRKERFELYRELDSDIMEMWIKLMRRHNERNIKKGNVSGRTIAGLPILSKEAQIDSDWLLIDAVNLVLDDWYEAFGIEYKG